MRQPDTVLKPKKCRLSQFHWILRRNSVLTPRGKYFNYKYKYCSDLFLRVTEVWIRCRVVAATIDAIQIFWICLRKIISFYDPVRAQQLGNSVPQSSLFFLGITILPSRILTYDFCDFGGKITQLRGSKCGVGGLGSTKNCPFFGILFWIWRRWNPVRDNFMKEKNKRFKKTNAPKNVAPGSTIYCKFLNFIILL